MKALFLAAALIATPAAAELQLEAMHEFGEGPQIGLQAEVGLAELFANVGRHGDKSFGAMLKWPFTKVMSVDLAGKAGVQYDRTHDESGFGAKAGLEAEYRLTAKWSAVAELYYVVSRVDSVEGRQFLAGVRYHF